MLAVLSEYRLLGVPILNGLIILFYLYLVLRLSFVFGDIHSKLAILAVMMSNTILYGLADTLAQTIRNYISFKAAGPQVALGPSTHTTIIQRGRPRQVLLDEESDDLADLGLGFLASTANPQEHTHPEVFDFRRLALFSAWGTLISCAQVPWYAFLNATWTDPNTFISVLQRVLCDQLVYSPISLACFLSYMAVVMERGNKHDVHAKLLGVWLPTLGINYCVWPPAQFLNFLAVPHSLQIVFSSVLSVFWNCFLSLKNA